MRRICCSPFWPARQPAPSVALKTDSMGKLGSSDVTSTVAICPRSIQLETGADPAVVRSELTILFRIVLFSPKLVVFVSRGLNQRAIDPWSEATTDILERCEELARS